MKKISTRGKSNSLINYCKPSCTQLILDHSYLAGGVNSYNSYNTKHVETQWLGLRKTVVNTVFGMDFA